ncbi:MAG TPA: hypothetical protein VJ957_11695 [Longimicrobiales bacterium]|nr:hypothetical protein [Longimicrobiales bacterium]
MIVSRRLLPVLLLLLAPTWVRAQGPEGGSGPVLEGTYTYVAEGSDDVKQAIDVAVKKVSWFIRTFARGRLEKTNDVYQTIVVERPDDTWSIAFDGRKPVVAPVSGDTVPWTREDGEKFQVVIHQVDARTLDEVFVASDGVRTNQFEWAPDGSMMAMHVKIESPKLKEPLTYTLNYRRQ